MNLQPIAAFLGFFGAVALFGSVSRWVYALAVTLRERRMSSQSERPAQPLIWSLLPMVLLHSGPWALGIAVACMYYALSQPRSPYLYWFLGGGLAGLIFMLILIGRAMRRSREATATQAEVLPLGSPAKPPVSLGDDTDEGYRLRLRTAIWTSVPAALILSAMWWQLIIRAPELLIVLAVLCFLFSWFLGWWFKLILFPKPWRLPPPK
jgi:hypothetical protein